MKEFDPGDIAADQSASIVSVTDQVRPVRIGARTGARTQILEGIAAGDRIVLEGTDRLRSGSKIRVIGDEPAAPGTGASGDTGQKGAAPAPSAAPRP